MAAAARQGGRSLWVGAPVLLAGGVLWALAVLEWEGGVGVAAAGVWEDPSVEEEGLAVVAGTSSAQVRRGVFEISS